MDNKTISKSKAFISYLDKVYVDGHPQDVIMDGWFEIIGGNGWSLKFKTHGGNVLNIPHCRILKVKEKCEEEKKGDDIKYGRKEENDRNR